MSTLEGKLNGSVKRVKTESFSGVRFKAKEPVSALTHFIAFIAAIFLTPVLLIHASLKGASELALISLGVFMSSMIILYGASSSYHGFNLSPENNVILKRLDHLSIFLLIAGSYTPICLCVLEEKRLFMFALVWSMALIGMCIKFFWIFCPNWFSSAIYIAMGWLVLLVFPQVKRVLPDGAFVMLLLGGIFYTVGGIIYSAKPKFMKKLKHGWGDHEVFHVFVMLGSLFHYIFMYLYIA